MNRLQSLGGIRPLKSMKSRAISATRTVRSPAGSEANSFCQHFCQPILMHDLQSISTDLLPQKGVSWPCYLLLHRWSEVDDKGLYGKHNASFRPVIYQLMFLNALASVKASISMYGCTANPFACLYGWPWYSKSLHCTWILQLPRSTCTLKLTMIMLQECLRKAERQGEWWILRVTVNHTWWPLLTVHDLPWPACTDSPWWLHSIREIQWSWWWVRPQSGCTRRCRARWRRHRCSRTAWSCCPHAPRCPHPGWRNPAAGRRNREPCIIPIRAHRKEMRCQPPMRRVNLMPATRIRQGENW